MGQARGEVIIDDAGTEAIKKLALEHSVLPPRPSVPFVTSELTIMVKKSFQPTGGDIQVACAAPSVGKTTAFAWMALNFFDTDKPSLKGTKSLMITMYKSGSGSYAQHMAKLLGLTDELDIFACLQEAMATKKEEAPSLLILDDFNDRGEEGCNILMVTMFMQQLALYEPGISMYIVTQDEAIADELLALNSWSKIGPMEGSTLPSREFVADEGSKPPPYVNVMQDVKSAWTMGQLTELVTKLFPKMATEEDGSISWLKEGMTPRRVKELGLRKSFPDW
eukprot:gene13831-16346_t